MCSERRPSRAGDDVRGVALDPAAMRDVFQRSLHPVPGRSYEIRECRIGPLSRGGGYHYAVRYDLRVEEKATGRVGDHVVTGVVYGRERGRRIWDALRADDPRGETADGPPFATFAYVPELDMLVQAFPHDHRLPALAALMAGPPPELEPSLLARFGPEGWRLVGWEAASVRYRVDTRATVRLVVRAEHDASGREEERGFYAKIFRDGADARRVDDTLRRLRDGVMNGGARFAVAEPIAFAAGLRTVVQTEVPGTPLLLILRRERKRDVMPVVRAAARAIADVHGLDLAPDRYLREGEDAARSLSTKLTRLERAAESLRKARPHLAPVVDETVAAVVAGLADVPLRPTHGDLKPDNVLVGEDGIALIDFDMLVASDPIQDVATMVEHLARARIAAVRRGAGGETAPQAFADEYFAHAPAAGRARLPLYRAMAGVVRAARLEGGRASGGSENVEDLLRNARAALAEGAA